MALAVFNTSLLNPSTSLFPRTHLPFPISKDFSEESLPLPLPPCFHFRSNQNNKKRCVNVKASIAEPPVATTGSGDVKTEGGEKKLKILVAGGGIGGLVFALAAKKKGFDVKVFERDLSAIRGEGQYRGPIQIQSNALGALEAIDLQVAEAVMNAGCVTGDRINGLVDGISGSWYVKFDTFTPAVERGLPITRVISRLTLQQILADAVGEDLIINGSNVVDFEDGGDKVTVILEDGQRYEGDLLVGADGIRSKVRKNLFGPSEPTYSGYTCYSGIADYVPADIDTVGYRVFLGHKQYFVSSDVGAGKMQWYAFHNEAPGGEDPPNGQKKRLLDIFGSWCDNVVDLLQVTDEEAILRRDIYDRIPIFTWGKGRVTLLGDSVHAMQPNLGQGGCMAIEDGYQLALELEKACKESAASGAPIDITSSIQRYENERKLRCAVIYGMARMAAIMASTYKPYLGVGLGPLSFLTKYRIPHPGRVGGRFFMDLSMPLTLSWVLGGNSEKLQGRSPNCRISDKASDQLQTWFRDDDALERALKGEWCLFPSTNKSDSSLQPIHLSRQEDKPCIIGRVSKDGIQGISIAVNVPSVSETHARISCKDGFFYVTDLQSTNGTWVIDIEERSYRLPPNVPYRIRPSDIIHFGSEKAAFKVKVLKEMPQNTEETPVLQAA